MTWKFEMQGPLKDWPSVVSRDGALIARTYGAGAESNARAIADQATAARAMLAVLRDMVARLHIDARSLPAVSAVIAQARAAGIEPEE